MSRRPVWHVRLVVQHQSSASGIIEIENRDLVCFREVEQTFSRGLAMARQLNAQPAEAVNPQDSSSDRLWPKAV